jgi:membrane protein required for colicin V production
MTPTGFDWLVIAIIFASALLAFLRGVIKELLALASWVVGLGAAFLFAGPVGALLPEMQEHPYLRYLIAFLGILVGVLVIGALIAWALRGGVQAIGLGFIDRGLGAVFGVARGLLIVFAFVIIAGSTGLSTQDWWQNSILAPWLARGALALKGNLPPVWADHLDSALGRKAPAPGTVKT